MAGGAAGELATRLKWLSVLHNIFNRVINSCWRHWLTKLELYFLSVQGWFQSFLQVNNKLKKENIVVEVSGKVKKGMGPPKTKMVYFLPEYHE